MPAHILPQTLSPVIVGPGCIRRDLPTSGGVRAWIVEMEPGATWPAIDHHDGFGEQVLILEGEVIEDGRVYGPGSYLNYGPHSSHQPRTETGVRMFGINVTDGEIA